MRETRFGVTEVDHPCVERGVWVGQRLVPLFCYSTFTNIFVKGLVFSHSVWFLCYGILTYAAYVTIT